MKVFSHTAEIIVFILFIVISFFWTQLSPFQTTDNEVLTQSRYIWGASYQLIALWGSLIGLLVAQKWGGYKSILGRSILMFALGLFFQVIGQTVYSYYNLVAKIEAPYPSLGDIGFFGSVVFYIYGALLMMRVSGSKFTFQSFAGRTQALFIPLLMLFATYWMFLRGYEFDWNAPITIFLDFGYPVLQAIYVSIAILALLSSRKILGGIMKKPILFVLIALLVQYVSDFNFLYQAHQSTWFVGGYGDYLYACSYLFMTLALISMGSSLSKIQAVEKVR